MGPRSADDDARLYAGEQDRQAALALLTRQQDSILQELDALTPLATDETPRRGLEYEDVVHGLRLRAALEAVTKKIARVTRPPATVTALSPVLGRDILCFSEMRGDPYQGRTVTADDLEDLGLTPDVTVASHLGTIHFSPPFEDGHERLLHIGFVEHDRRVIARTFVRSHSQVVLRGIAGYGMFEGRFGWYGKNREQSLLLGLSFQAALARLQQERPRDPLRLPDPSLVIAGLNRLKDLQANLPFTPRDQERITSHDENIRVLRPHKTIREGDEDYEPDFSVLAEAFVVDSPLYGPCRIELFPCRNGNIDIAFGRDRHNRIWHAASEVVATSIGSTGLNTMWCDVDGLLNTPAYEYAVQLATQGLPGNHRLRRGLHGSEYVDAFDTILRHQPVIQRYYAERGVEMPSSEQLAD